MNPTHPNQPPVPHGITRRDALRLAAGGAIAAAAGMVPSLLLPQSAPVPP